MDTVSEIQILIQNMETSTEIYSRYRYKKGILCQKMDTATEKQKTKCWNFLKYGYCIKDCMLLLLLNVDTNTLIWILYCLNMDTATTVKYEYCIKVCMLLLEYGYYSTTVKIRILRMKSNGKNRDTATKRNWTLILKE